MWPGRSCVPVFLVGSHRRPSHRSRATRKPTGSTTWTGLTPIPDIENIGTGWPLHGSAGCPVSASAIPIPIPMRSATRLNIPPVCVCVCVFVLLVIPCAFFECFTRSLGVSSFRPCSQCGACCPLGWQPPRSLLAIVRLAACARDAPPSASGGQVLACLPRKSHGGCGSRLRTTQQDGTDGLRDVSGSPRYGNRRHSEHAGDRGPRREDNNATPPAAPVYRIQDETTPQDLKTKAGTWSAVSCVVPRC